MRADDRLEDLPEARPLYRVAPWWRLLAFFAGITVAGLLVAVLILSIVLIRLEERPATMATPAMVPPPAVFGTVPPAMAASRVDDSETEGQNLPYPVKADLADSVSTEPLSENPPSAAKPSLTARDRFLDKGTDLWKLKGPVPDEMVISPDGRNIAYVAQGHLVAGVIGEPRHIVGTVEQTVAVPSFVPGRGFRAAYTNQTVAYAEIKLLGPPAWSADNHTVYCADANGHFRRYDLSNSRPDGQVDAQILPFGGASPAVVPGESEKLIFVRTQPRPKVAVPGSPFTPDLTEIVLYDATTLETQVLVPASISAWRHLAVSPDGKRLALVSDRGHEGQRVSHLRVFLLDLAGGEPKPLTSAWSQVGSVCWTADSQAVLYARSQDPVPADHWQEEPLGPQGALDLYQTDLATQSETRLSRGGGCLAPSVDAKEDLFYLAVQNAGSSVLLRRVPLALAREFAAAEPRTLPHDATAWTSLFNRVLEEMHLAASSGEVMLSAATLAKLAETFHTVYRERFHEEPPATLQHFARLRRELEKVKLPADVYPALTLMIGALESHALIRDQGARWHWSKGPVLPAEAAVAENAFGYVVHPFASARAWARQAVHLEPEASDQSTQAAAPEALLRRAEGRALVLSNDPSAARTILAELTDPEFGLGAELLQQGNVEQAERHFQNMLQHKRHERNVYLGLQIGNLLFAHQQWPALQRWMERQCEQAPHDARKYNLLGLALLPTEPQQAVEAFKKALRCELRFEAGYLNLAQAYQLAKDPQSARLCLQRYLALLPEGSYAADARQRLTTVDKSGN